MASMNSLLASWNFDIVSGSDSTGEFTVPDVSNNYYGSGINFITSSHEFILKEEIKTNRTLTIGTIESIDSIQTLDELDETRITSHNPSSMQLHLENSMFQTISDEMLNMFSSVSAYAFRFAESADRYRDEYDNLKISRTQFFSKVLNKPDLEKYLEFYKWIDSSLGDLLERLKPESSNNSKGLKNTVESHILERNKFKHKLPLTIEPNRTFSSNLRSNKSFVGTFSVSSSYDNRENGNSDLSYVTSSVTTAKISYEPGIDYIKNYQILQTAGKLHNHRNSSLYPRENKTVFRSVFSSGDGLSDDDRNRDISGEYSSYNSLNFRAAKQKVDFNASQALPLGRSDKPRQGEINQTDFRDNSFVERNIPYESSSYSNSGMVGYSNIPNQQVKFLHDTNILLDYNGSTYENSIDIVEPPIEFDYPSQVGIRMSTSIEDIQTLSPHDSQINKLSKRNTQKIETSSLLLSLFDFSGIKFDFVGYRTPFILKITYLADAGLLKINYKRHSSYIFPRTDLVGLARVRTKSRYEEEEGYFREDISPSDYPEGLDNFDPPYVAEKRHPWTNSSYNNNSYLIRSFWRDNQEDRLRTRGYDTDLGTGSFNCFYYPNKIQPSFDGANLKLNLNNYDSIYSMDSYSNVEFPNFGIISSSIEIYGDLSPYSHIKQYLLTNFIYTTYNVKDKITNIMVSPRPQFVHILYMDKNSISGSTTYGEIVPNDIEIIYNKSYQDGVDCNIRPFYDKYEDFRENIKHMSQVRSIIPEFIISNYAGIIDNDEFGATNYFTTQKTEESRD